MTRPFILGTRASALALAQTELTKQALARVFPELEVQVEQFVTRGDQKLDLSLIRNTEAGGKGLFTKELEDALLDGRIDVAVHSLKDLPGHNPAGLEIAGVLERAATADLLLATRPMDFHSLPQGAVVGTSSVRRARQLQWKRPDLQVQEFRGNVQTRLRKLAASEVLSAIVLAQAGLDRLGYPTSEGQLSFEGVIYHLSSLSEVMLPAIGQGAIALQAKVGQAEVAAVIAAINHGPTFIAVRAERELQRLLSGDCTLPVGVRTSQRGDRLSMVVRLFGEENQEPRQAEAEGEIHDPEAVAVKAFSQLGYTSQ